MLRYLQSDKVDQKKKSDLRVRALISTVPACVVLEDGDSVRTRPVTMVTNSICLNLRQTAERCCEKAGSGSAGCLK